MHVEFWAEFFDAFNHYDPEFDDPGSFNLSIATQHLGSMERDLDNIASHLDKYPNFAIDTAARMEYLMLMPPEKVSAFLIKYQDRVLYGTDLDLHAAANLPDALTEWQSRDARDWKFLATGGPLPRKASRCVD